MKVLFFLINLFISVALTGQSKSQYNCRWSNGNLSELSFPLSDFDYNLKADIYYLVLNNDINVTIYIALKNSEVLNCILEQGMTIWINMEGKKLKETGIRFPLGSQYVSGSGRYNKGSGIINHDGSVKTPFEMANSMEIIGFKAENKRVLPLENSENFSASISFGNDNILYYKIVMPIDKLQVRNSKKGNGAMPFVIGLEYGVPPIDWNDGVGTLNNYITSPVGSPSGSALQPSLKTSRVLCKPVMLWIRGIKLAAKN